MRKVNYAVAKKTTTTWLTPKSIVDLLGPFDLDPCTPCGGEPVEEGLGERSNQRSLHFDAANGSVRLLKKDWQ